MASGEAAQAGKDGNDQPQQESSEPEKQQNHSHGSEQSQQKDIRQSTTVFVFWAYFVALVSLLTLLFIVMSSLLSPVDEQAEHFAMPSAVRQHLARGKLLKIEFGQDRRPVKVFAREEGPLDNTAECVVLLHGLGSSSFMYQNMILELASRGLHVIAMDFPGAGLSEKPSRGTWGFFDRFREIYDEVSEKGIFWRFEELFETGTFPDRQTLTGPSKTTELDYNGEDLADSLSQVLSLLVAKPVHIVAHDTSVEAGLTWATQNPTRARSITIIDALPSSPSFPAGILAVPGLGSMITLSPFFFGRVLQTCCVRSLTDAEIESYAFLLGRNNGRRSTILTWKGLDRTFNVASHMEGLGGLPQHIMWSEGAGQQWQEIGKMLASDVHNASFSQHSGGRWLEKDGNKVVKDVYQFISSLPPTEHIEPDEALPQHVQEMFNQMSGDEHGHGHYSCQHGHGHDHHGHNHGHGHNSHDQKLGHDTHDHGLGSMDGMGFGGWGF